MSPEDERPSFERPVEIEPASEPAETRFLKWALFGAQGLRAGWSVALFIFLFFLVSAVLGAIIVLAIAEPLHIDLEQFTPKSALLLELMQFLPVVTAAAACALVERRRIVDYNLTGQRRSAHFFTGLVAGAVALSALIGLLDAGGWLSFGPTTLNGGQIVKYGLVWGLTFLLTGLTEEGGNRCYLLFTLTRSINFWWASGSAATLCLLAFLNTHGNGTDGVYFASAIGVVPCFLLQVKGSPSTGFWNAAWLTSTLFGYFHTFNPGESWIGIFSAAAIGFVFCASVRLTGSAWWAIGFHASWDWAQTFFYGTADSGLVPTGHFLSSTPTGAVLWSGGSDGPEGSVLVIPVVVLVLLALVAIYGRKTKTESTSPAVASQLS